MKKIILFTILILSITYKAQTYPLTETNLPENSYRKDINNDLIPFEGNWKGSWKGKFFTINLKKIIHDYNDNLKIYNDRLIGKFQVKDTNGNILFDNLNIEDNKAKIEGSKMFSTGKYVLTYSDPNLCLKGGMIFIEFTNSSKSEMKFKFMDGSQVLNSECFYRGWPADQRPEPLPKEIVLTKQ
ncbi:DUF6705 family protein [Chryseobacterium kwangjuense]|uniref:DUF6705 domain-containing protein n=1 Tax=Chryseobacterium kwangjuense TaxID=267125 RepID=A0A135WDS2_9FLAO|nr:DUF6705 family protein [Chryseobacterium kwangjuense]KXH83037.1 hypothetical protein AU378_11415 [Chryseobacterium kwangjuense]